MRYKGRTRFFRLQVNACLDSSAKRPKRLFFEEPILRTFTGVDFWNEFLRKRFR